VEDYGCTVTRRSAASSSEKEGRAFCQPADLLIACSSGGHVIELLALREAWQAFDRVWVSDDTSDVRSLLSGERLYFAAGPTTRNARALLLNLALAWRLQRRYRPRVVLAAGGATAVPFAWVGRLHGARVVFVECWTRIDEPSLSFRLIAPVADRLYVQWPELASSSRRARYVGRVPALFSSPQQPG
jgi:beta-1,4-N-acetylglucosaminyltransferase